MAVRAFCPVLFVRAFAFMAVRAFTLAFVVRAFMLESIMAVRAFFPCFCHAFSFSVLLASCF